MCSKGVAQTALLYFKTMHLHATGRSAASVRGVLRVSLGLTLGYVALAAAMVGTPKLYRTITMPEPPEPPER